MVARGSLRPLAARPLVDGARVERPWPDPYHVVPPPIRTTTHLTMTHCNSVSIATTACSSARRGIPSMWVSHRRYRQAQASRCAALFCRRSTEGRSRRGSGADRAVAAATVNAFEVSFVRFDGNRDLRAVRRKPCDPSRNFRNVELSGIGFHVRYVESTRAVCGSGMTVGASSQFEIVNSWFYNNGLQPEDADGVAGLWSDGLNVFNCTGATIRDNAFWDNTDVDLGVNGGLGCAVYRNTIEHFSAYAFAGLVAGDPSRSGGEFSNNQITSASNLLGFGLVVGCHAWFECGGGYEAIFPFTTT